MSNSGNPPTSSTHLEDLDDSISQTEIVKNLRKEAQRRGFQKPLNTDGIEIEFKIEVTDEITDIPVPQFFISDRVSWRPLPGDDDPPEGGYIIGMKYNASNLQEPPTLLEGVEEGWSYLIYLAPDSPSRSWTRTDWAAEADLILQEALCSGVSTPSKEDTNLES